MKSDLYAMIKETRRQNDDLESDNNHKSRKKKKSWKMGLTKDEQMFVVMDNSDSKGTIDKDNIN